MEIVKLDIKSLYEQRKKYIEESNYLKAEEISKKINNYKSFQMRKQEREFAQRKEVEQNTFEKAYTEELIQFKERWAKEEENLKNYEKFKNHQNLYHIQNQKHLNKISKWRKDYRKKERREKIIREEELNKKIQTEKGYPKDIIIQRLNEIKQKCESKIRKLRLKLTNKDNKLKIYKDQKEKIIELISQINSLKQNTKIPEKSNIETNKSILLQNITPMSNNEKYKTFNNSTISSHNQNQKLTQHNSFNIEKMIK